MTSSCKWLTALKYDLVLCEGWITNRCSGNEPGLPRERQRKSSLYYLLCESNKRRLAYYFDRSIVYWPIIVKFRKLKQTFVVFYRWIGLFLYNTLSFQKYFLVFPFYECHCNGVLQERIKLHPLLCIISLNKQKKRWFVVRLNIRYQ